MDLGQKNLVLERAQSLADSHELGAEGPGARARNPGRTTMTFVYKDLQ